MRLIFNVLRKEGELSIRQVASKTGMERSTAAYYLRILKDMHVLVENVTAYHKRHTRLYKVSNHFKLKPEPQYKCDVEDGELKMVEVGELQRMYI